MEGSSEKKSFKFLNEIEESSNSKKTGKDYINNSIKNSSHSKNKNKTIVNN